jgi:hypothetical protein
MNEYMVERYLPGITASQLDEARERLAAAALELTAEGVEVRYIGSTFIPEEESCFCRFEGPAAADVRRACELAGVPFARIVETHDFSQHKEGQ